MVAHRSWKSFGVLDRRSLTCMGVGRLWEVDGYGSSTVMRLISSCLEQTSKQILPIKDSLYGQRQIKLFHRKNIGYTKVSVIQHAHTGACYTSTKSLLSPRRKEIEKKCMLRLR